METTIFKRDQLLWSKTPQERAAWKKVRRFPVPDINWMSKGRDISPFVKVIIHTEGMPKTTYSHVIRKAKLPELLNSYKTKDSKVTKYYIIN